jgi:hypothetical protein
VQTRKTSHLFSPVSVTLAFVVTDSVNSDAVNYILATAFLPTDRDTVVKTDDTETYLKKVLLTHKWWKTSWIMRH